MLKTAILSILLISATHQTCIAGCLKCTELEECLIPDTFNLYKLTDGSPEKLTLEHCIMVDFLGNCLLCAEKTYPDAANNKCIPIPDDGSAVANCHAFASPSNCHICSKNFVVKDGKCVEVTTVISGCRFYNNQEACVECEGDGLLAADGLTCLDNPKENGCVSYGYVGCNGCVAGFAATSNGFLDIIRRTEAGGSRLPIVAYLHRTLTQTNAVSPLVVCEKGGADNCKNFESGVNKCIECNDNYFLTEKAMCEKYPESQIPNCRVYSSLTKCEACVARHYFAAGKCTVVAAEAAKENCSKYDTSASSVKCKECGDNFYVSSGSCVARVHTKDDGVANCSVKDLTADKCLTCKEDFVMASDELACFSKLADCVNYQPTAKDGDLKCSLCQDGYYLKNNNPVAGSATPHTECLAGGVTNCKDYLIDSDSNCVTCMNGFVKEGTDCVKSNDIPDCLFYSKTNKTLCEICLKEKSFNFVLKKNCSSIASVIDNCAVHDSGSLAAPVCSACKAGYELRNNGCVALTITGCEKTDGNGKCTLCTKGKALHSNKETCEEPLEYITDKCEINSTKDDQNDEEVADVTCTTCKTNAYPINFQNNFICIPNDNIQEVATNVPNCIKYDENYNCVQCDTGSSSKFLKATSPPSCVSGCGAANAEGPYNKIVVAKAVGSTNYEIEQFNVCVSAGAIAGCLVHAPDLTHDDLTPICLGCLGTHLPIVTLTETKYSPTNPCPSDFPYISASFVKYPEVTCKIRDGATIDNSLNANINGSSLFKTVTGTNYITIKCQFKFTSTISANGHLESCAEDSGCGTKRLTNIALLWEQLFSCHSCSNNNHIPFLAVQVIDINTPTFTKFSKWSTTKTSDTFANTTGTEKNVVCKENSHAAFGVASSGDYGVDPNCALGLVFTNVNGVTNYTAGSPTYVTACAACKPGFARTAAPAAHLARSCTQITNCAGTGSMANGCENCNSGFIHKYDNNNIVFDSVADSCLAVPNEKTELMANCWAAEAAALTAGGSGGCSVCMKGYHLNKDGRCEAVSAVNCSTGRLRFSYKVAKAALDWGLYQQGQGVGCDKCESSFSAVKLTTTKNICIESEWVKDKIGSITDISKTNYIPNCKNYGAGDAGDLVCDVCKAGFVIKGVGSVANGQECYASNELQNCKIASSSDNCTACVDASFGIKVNKCIQGTIGNCGEYNHAESRAEIACMKCEDGYYLKTGGECLLGSVPNCDKFINNQPDQCEICKPGFKKVSIKDNIVYCYPISDSLNCSGMDIVSTALGADLTCSACKDPTTHLVVTPTAEENNSICMAYAALAECIEYDLATTLAGSTFKCKKCSPDFYLDAAGNKCVKRENKQETCSDFHLTKDECVLCKTDYFLDTTNGTCIAYPIGIVGCERYAAADECVKCGPGRHLQEKICPLVNPAIDNCLYYSSDKNCSLCKEGHMSKENKCEKASALNCVTYHSLTACAACGALFGLETNGSSTDCVKKTLIGCTLVDDNDPYPCKECDPSQYLTDGECKEPTAIPGCAAYSGQETCSLCKKGFALSKDKKKCENSGIFLSHIDVNCVDSFVAEKPICSGCGAGMWFAGGGCVGLCEGEGEGMEECGLCDPASPDECYMCKIGTFMDKEGKCSKGGGDDGGEGEDDGNSSGRFGVMIVIVVALLFR